MSEYTDAVERGLRGIMSASVGVSPGCEQCENMHSDEDWAKENYDDSAGFSWSECGICGSYLGGDRYVWHWLADDNEVMHEDDCCVDCAMYMANGEEPEDWSRG